MVGLLHICYGYLLDVFVGLLTVGVGMLKPALGTFFPPIGLPPPGPMCLIIYLWEAFSFPKGNGGGVDLEKGIRVGYWEKW